jgi:hypothetical protein
MANKTLLTIKKISIKVSILLLSILFIVGVIYSIFIHLVFRNLINPDSFNTLLTEVDFYETSQPSIANLIFNFSENGETNNVFSNQLSISAWNNLAEIIFPAQWVQDTVDGITQSLWAWLDNPEGGLPKLSISLSQPIQILRSRQGILAFLPFLENRPRCANSDLIVEIYQKGIPDCVPYETTYLEVSQLIAMNFSQTIIENVDFELLISQGFMTNKTISLFEDIHKIYYLIFNTKYYSIIVSLFLFFLYCLLLIKQPNIDYRSFMNPIIIAGVLSLLIFGFLWAFMYWGWEVFLTTNFAYLNSNSLTLIKNIGLQISEQIIKPGIIISLILVITSLGLWLLTHFLQSSNRKQKIIENQNTLKTRRVIRKQFR